MASDILDLIDSAVRDWETSEDAMRCNAPAGSVTGFTDAQGNTWLPMGGVITGRPDRDVPPQRGNCGSGMRGLSASYVIFDEAVSLPDHVEDIAGRSVTVSGEWTAPATGWYHAGWILAGPSDIH